MSQLSRRNIEDVKKLVAASGRLDRYGQQAMRRVGSEAVAAAAAITRASLDEGEAAVAGRSDRDVRHAVDRYHAAYGSAEQQVPEGFLPRGSRELILIAASEAPRALAGLGIGASHGEGGGRGVGVRGGPVVEL